MNLPQVWGENTKHLKPPRSHEESNLTCNQKDLPIISVARGPGLFSKISSIAQIQATRLQQETKHVVGTARVGNREQAASTSMEIAMKRYSFCRIYKCTSHVKCVWARIPQKCCHHGTLQPAIKSTRSHKFDAYMFKEIQG